MNIDDNLKSAEAMKFDGASNEINLQRIAEE